MTTEQADAANAVAQGVASIRFAAMQLDRTAFSAESWAGRSRQDAIHHRLLVEILAKGDQELAAAITDETAETVLKLVENFRALAERFAATAEAFQAGEARLLVALHRYGWSLDAEGRPAPVSGRAC